MAESRKAQITAIRRFGADSSVLELAITDRMPLGFEGGQYLIVNSGLPLPGGKTAKRAYSVLSSDRVQEQFQLGVKRIAGGHASVFLQELRAGDTIQFSGPWGKFTFDEEPADGAPLIVASDTGITAALGLLRGKRAEHKLAGARLVWLSESEDYFLAWGFVRECLEGAPREFRMERIAGVGMSWRVAETVRIVEKLLEEEMPTSLFFAGDGELALALENISRVAAIPAARRRVETYFNHPVRKAAA